MAFLDRLERKFGWLSFPGFLRYYALFQALVYGLQFVRPNIGALLDFDRAKILSGEVWRVITFLFASSGNGYSMLGAVFLIFMIQIAFMISDALEDSWGEFRTSIFYYTGILCTIGANFLFDGIFPGSGYLLYGAAFFAFATLFPRVVFQLFFVLPVQVRFLAFLSAAFLLLAAIGSPILFPYFLICLLNYLLWAGIPALRGRAAVLRAGARRQSFQAQVRPGETETFHRCAVCGRTELDSSALEFRVGADGEEYCTDHLPQ